MPLVLQLQLVMMTMYSKFGVDTDNLSNVLHQFFCMMTTVDDNLASTIVQLFLKNRQAKNKLGITISPTNWTFRTI